MELLTVQKANFWKRLSAWLLDTVLAITLAMGVATLLSAILQYEKINEPLIEIYAKYEQTYGVDLGITPDELSKLTEEELAAYQAKYEEAAKAFNEDKEALAVYKTVNEKLFTFTLVILTVSSLVGIMTMHFIVPLFFKNGKTLGKKVFGLSVVHSNCVRVSNKVLFIRTLFGQYTIETVFPLAMLLYFGVSLNVGSITVLLLIALECGVMLYTKNNSSIHDLLADTVVVDTASQRVFDTQEEMQEYIKEQKRLEAEKAAY
jgi:uncharacterized RDD family membrane protein YckC